MSDPEYELDSDHEVSKDHSKLLEAVSKLDKGQRVKKPERSEPSIQVSEFHLVKSGVTDRDTVYLDDLVKSLHSKPHHQQLSQKFKNTRKKSRFLQKPLERPQAERLKREIGFENAKKQLQKWDAVVTRNRVAPHLSFPLQQPSFKGVTTDEFVKRFRVQSDLEKELAALEPPKPAEEEKDQFSLTLEEILQRRREAARFRAQQSYREAKAHRQNKIKSKKFHRIQRKAKIKQQIKDFEQLQKTDPEAALEKLEQLDRTRAEERMSLRHKSTGQWAKNKQIRAKYDKESRQVLAQQLSISRELTQKVQKAQDSDEDDVNAEVTIKDKDNPWVNSVKTEAEIDDFISGYRKYWEEKNKADKEKKKQTASEGNREDVVPVDVPEALNPVEQVVEEVVSAREQKSNDKKANKVEASQKAGEKVVSNGKVAKKSNKLRAKSTSEWEVELLPSGKVQCPSESDIDTMFSRIDKKIQRKVQNKLKYIKKTLDRLESAENNVEVNGRVNSSDVPDLSFKRMKLRPDIDEVLEEVAGGAAPQSSEKSNDFATGSTAVNGAVESGVKRAAEIDPTKFIAVKPKHLKTQLPDDVMGDYEGMDDSEDEEAQHNIISEAFADDDVVDEFRKEKDEEIKKSQPEDIDLRLPGWGSWGGKNIQNGRKKRRFILKFPKEAPRRDENKGDVIIVEDANTKVRQHLVTDLPFPFTSVADYEASIRAPIGRNFVPETAHKRLIQPPVNTKMGQIIEPMDEDVLLKRTIKVRGKLPEGSAKSKEVRNGKTQASQKAVKRKGNGKKAGKSHKK